MKALFAVLILAAALFAGCATQPSQPGADKKPRHAGRVQIVMFDTTPRDKVDHIDFFDVTHTVLKPHKDIAILTCEGTPREESPMTEAIIYRSRIMGANAVVMLPPSRSGWGDRRVFRAKAMVYEAPDKN